ncbi:MAG: cytochrome c [Hyphomonas sp.]|uniref:cytochrome c n=1 Tax=Hyphomonas sp. TaxID=87 RepID=UPI0034A009B3
MRPERLLVAVLLALSLPACSRPSETLAPEAAAADPAEGIVLAQRTEQIGRGEAIAETSCAGCHALGAADESPHGDAPPLRLLNQTINLDTLEARFADATISNHPDMPDWQFEQNDINGLVAYLKSVQVGGAD